LIADNNQESVVADNVLSMVQRKFRAEGFNILDRRIISKNKIVKKLFRKILLANSKGIGKDTFENLIQG
jgi:hypothetical protein